LTAIIRRESAGEKTVAGNIFLGRPHDHAAGRAATQRVGSIDWEDGTAASGWPAQAIKKPCSLMKQKSA
jgi:hypothetical protein